MHILALDGHPAENSLSTALLDRYCHGASEAGAEITRHTLRHMQFDPILHDGYRKRQEWEPDLAAFAEDLQACDHLLLSFPMWWGGQPALLKGFIDRVFLPGFTFKYHDDDPFWDRLMTGKSADVIITADTPKPFLQFVYGSPILKQMRGQVLGFCGFKPLHQHYFAPAHGRTPEQLQNWLAKAEKLGRKAVR